MNVRKENSSPPIRIGVLLSGGGRTLTNILDRIRSGELNAQVVVVIASRPCKGIALGEQANIPTHLIPYKQMPGVQRYSDEICKLLDAARVELVVQAGFLSLWHVPPRYAGHVMNIHPALLPSFGGHGMYGHHVHEAVLAAGCKVSGCTVHFVTNEYDRGPIIVQKCVAVQEGDTPDTLAARVFEAECQAYPEAIALFSQGRLKIDSHNVRVSPSACDKSAASRA
ncbi:MAG: phosphoribosylglycinamide formyltransferase [Planctomycetaceae bacterium]|nr:phosphoribosylglycinamide formyltransferase [Planctomycetaceae bacterium]